MDTIKNMLLVNFTENNLYILFFYYHQMNPIEVMYFWNCVLNLLDESNVLPVLGFIFDLQDTPLHFPRYAQKSLNFHIHQVNKKIAKLLSKEYIFYVKNLKLFKFAKELKAQYLHEKKFDSNLFFVNNLYELLIKTSTIEISNSIESYFNFVSFDNVSVDVTSKLLNNIYVVELKQRNLYVKYICTILTDPKDILDFIFYHMTEEEPSILVEYIYLLNKTLYNSLLNVLYENKRFYRVEIIRLFFDINLVKLDLKDENIELIKYFLVNKPIFVNDLYEVLKNKVSKKHLTGLYIEHYEILKHYKFDLNIEDLLSIASDKPDLLYEIYDMSLDGEQKQRFYSIFKMLDEDFIINFLIKHSDLDLVSYLLTNRQLKNNLKNYIITRYKNIPALVYKMFIYFDKSDVVNYIEDFLIDKKSLEYFLFVLKPTDILIYAHEMSNISKGIKILDLCFDSPAFNENDFIYTLNTIEDSMPALIIRTLILTYKKYPHLRNFTVNFLYKIINKNALQNSKLKTGIIKCLEILKSSSVEIIASLSEERILTILDGSKMLKDLCIETVYKADCKYSKEYNILRDVLRKYY